MFTNELKAYFIARKHCIHAIMLHHIGHWCNSSKTFTRKIRNYPIILYTFPPIYYIQPAKTFHNIVQIIT